MLQTIAWRKDASCEARLLLIAVAETVHSQRTMDGAGPNQLRPSYVSLVFQTFRNGPAIHFGCWRAKSGCARDENVERTRSPSPRPDLALHMYSNVSNCQGSARRGLHGRDMSNRFEADRWLYKHPQDLCNAECAFRNIGVRFKKVSNATCYSTGCEWRRAAETATPI